MDDLNGLDWSNAPSSSSVNKTTYASSASPFAYPSLQPTPTTSGRSTPLNQPLNSKPPQLRSKPGTPANDSFASLLGKPSSGQTNTLSLQERQRQIQEQKSREEAEQRKRFDQRFGTTNAQWDTSRSSSNPVLQGQRLVPATASLGASPRAVNKGLQPGEQAAPTTDHDEEDLLAAFSASAPVDASSHFPPPRPITQSPTLAGDRPAAYPTNDTGQGGFEFNDDDDPFGLGQISRPLPNANSSSAPQIAIDDDDFLGMLGRPAEEVARETARRKTVETPTTSDEARVPMDPRDKAVAELVDMGFTAEKAAQALEQTDDGVNVQAAVGILLNAAHSEAKQKAQPPRPKEGSREQRSQPSSEGNTDSGMPAWMQREQERDRSASRNRDERQAGVEKDVTQIASEFGSSLFKSANSLWKQGQKKVQKAVAEFQTGDTGIDSSQPKWMRETQGSVESKQTMKSREAVTDEVAMLEGSSRPQRNGPRGSQAPSPFGQGSSRHLSSDGDKLSGRSTSRPQQPTATAMPASRVSTRGYIFEGNENELAVASSRRRKATPVQQQQHGQTPVPPSLTSSAPTPTFLQSKNPFNSSASSPQSSQTQSQSTVRPRVSTPLPSRPKAPPRTIPHVETAILIQSARSRRLGTEAFKRGDYAAAHEAYSAALRPLPSTHPVAIIILSNRALTALKTGEPKQSIADADAALLLIGVGKGEGEQIALLNETGAVESKEMKESYGKAILRKAEALEHLERWSEAAAVWREAVESGVGGAVAIRGRDRTEKAAGGGKPSSGSATSSARASPHPSASVTAASNRRRPATSAPVRPSNNVPANAGVNSAAVKALRAHHAAQNAEEDEKFALTDTVDAKLTAWKGTKQDNLRALLGSLDTVLWAEAGWTKVSMGDLIMPNRVKIVYMKAISRVHPDKISQCATTEQRMLAASIFATLNEAWDGFKRENNL